MVKTKSKKRDLPTPYQLILRHLPTSGLKAIFREYCGLMKIDRKSGEIWIAVSNPVMLKLLAQRSGDISLAASTAIGCPLNAVFRLIK